MKASNFFYFPLLFIACHSFLFSAPTVDISPTDGFAFVGDKLIYRVKLLDAASFPLSDVSFTVTPHPERGDPFNRRIILTNRTHGYVELNITEGIGGRTNVHCFHGKDIVCSSILIVEQPMENITGNHSIWHYKKSLEITWQLNQQYIDPGNFDISAVINPSQQPTDNSKQCTVNENSLNSAECNKTMNGGIHYFRVCLELNNIGKKKYAESVAFNEVGKPAVFKQCATFKILPMYQVKPFISEPIMARNVTSTCATLSGEVPLGIKDLRYSLIAHLSVFNTEKNETKKEQYQLESSNYQNSGMSFTLCNLRAATKYDVSLKVKPAKHGHWSNNTSIVFSTREDRPAQAPPLLPTNFFVGPCHKGNREATFIWNKPLKDYTNGDVTQFSVRFYRTTDILQPFENYATQRIPCDITCDIELHSFTKVGRSLKSSTLIIPNEDEDLELDDDLDVKMMIAPTNSTRPRTIIGSWVVKHHEEAEGVNMVIYRCQASLLTLRKCSGDFITYIVPLTHQSVVLSNLDPNINRFGYALERGSRVRGIKWINCVYNPTKVPEKPTQVRTYRTEEPGSIEVSWASSQCTEQDMTLILKNHVRFCPKASNGSCFHDVVEGRFITSYKAQGLDPSRSYDITVWSESSGGVGPESDPVEAKPMDYRDDGSWKYIFVLVALSILICLALIVVYLRCDCLRKSKVSIFMKQINMEIPLHHKDIFFKESSGESGVYSGHSESTEVSSQISQQEMITADSLVASNSQNMLAVSRSSSSSHQIETEMLEAILVSKIEPLTPPVPAISSSTLESPCAAVPDKCEDLPDSNNPFRDIHQESSSQPATMSKFSGDSNSSYYRLNFKTEGGKIEGNSLMPCLVPPVSKANIETPTPHLGNTSTTRPPTPSVPTISSSTLESPCAAVPDKCEDLPDSNNPPRDIHQESSSPPATMSKFSGDSNSSYYRFNLTNEGGKIEGNSLMPCLVPPVSKANIETPTPHLGNMSTTRLLTPPVPAISSSTLESPCAAVPDKCEDLPDSNSPLRDIHQESSSQPATMSKFSGDSNSSYYRFNLTNEGGKIEGNSLMPCLVPPVFKANVETSTPHIDTGNLENTPVTNDSPNIEPNPIDLNGACDANHDDMNRAELFQFLDSLKLEIPKKESQMPSVGNNNITDSIEPTPSSHKSPDGIERKISEDSGVVSPGARLLEENSFPSLVMTVISETPGTKPGVSVFVKEGAVDEPIVSDETKSLSSLDTWPEFPAHNQLGDSQQSHSNMPSVPPEPAFIVRSHDSDYCTIVTPVPAEKPHCSNC